MTRQIFTVRDLQQYRALAAPPEPSPSRQPDGYKEKLIKHIPVDVVTLYVFLDNVVNQYGPNVPHGAAVGVFWVGLAFTPLYL